ncbi:MAG TPA: hybrid sensor histidine kinase/response regulator, partial [Polyangiaceae bacterium]|nr:hybrid sensor histidine kinase/response regulator [Polyangiaceae bacterium]
GVAHEINNPLSHVIAEIELALRALQTAPEVSSEAVQSLQSARDGALRIARVVRDIHSFGRVEPLVTGPVDVGAAIERAIDLTWNQVRHHARLVRDFTNVPPVLADESRLVQVVVNLIANAVDAVSDARNGEITIATRASDSAVSVAISDTGKGIPAAQLGHVFDPFFTTKSVGKGMGLGLAICHGIVTQLGGSIQVHSEPGRGTTFHVSLPRSNGSTGANLAAPAGGTLPRARILFIDDEVSLCSAMTRLLQPEHDVVSATRGQEALDLLRSGERFDMIMCDLMMPGMTGMAFFEALQDLPAVDPESVVFMTGGAFGEPAQRFLASVANPCFYKPIDPNQLRQWLRARQLGPVP